MSHCYECGGEAGEFWTTKWSVEGTLVDVPVCQTHAICAVCDGPMEVNPISLRVECFRHGLAKA